MPYTFSPVAWEAWPPSRGGSGQRQEIDKDRDGVAILPSPESAHGIKVVVTNPDDYGDTHQFWTYTLHEYANWNDWWVHIGAQMARHGMELGDEGIPENVPIDEDGGDYW